MLAGTDPARPKLPALQAEIDELVDPLSGLNAWVSARPGVALPATRAGMS
jgi:hypothetical protein